MTDNTDMDELVADITGQKIEQPSPEAPVSSPAAPAEPARDEHGRFTKPADPPPPVEPIPVAAPIAPQPEAPKVEGIPLHVALEWKTERNAMKKELEEFRQSQQQQIQVPSPLEDPDGYAAYQAQMIAHAQWVARAETSELIARTAHGDNLVQQAMDWSMEKSTAEKNRLGYSPFAVDQMRQRHPVDWVVKQFEQENWLKEVGNDQAARDAWALKRAAELSANPSPQPLTNGAAPPQPRIPPQPTPQRSLAAAPTAGAHTSEPLGMEAAADFVLSR